MMHKIWRYSHLYLAISSSLFLLLAAVTGIILAFEPIQKQIELGHTKDLSEVVLTDIIPKLNSEYDEVFELKRLEDDLVYVSALSLENDIDGEYLIDLNTGKPRMELPKQSDFFEFITSLHRSLFLKNTGRWLVGINSFFLFLMVVTGLVLLIKRQQGIQNIFKKVIHLDFSSYSHTYLGRLMLLPLAILSMSAVTLFLIRFEYIPHTEPLETTFEIDLSLPNKSLKEFDVFSDYTLADIKSVEFPFSEFEEDYFILNLKDKTLYIHQYTGQVVQEISHSNSDIFYDLSLFLHTGKSSILWSIVLALSGLSILYFMYSGLQMSLPRFIKKTYNTYQAEEAEIIVLYGSESGSTQHFAHLFFEALLHADKKVFITSLNQYQSFPQMKKLIIFTSTHGKGEAPHNAYYFDKRLETFENKQTVHYSVVGFGSTHYTDFCAYAKEVQSKLQEKENFQEEMPIHLIDNKSSSALKSWWTTWNKNNDIQIKIPDKLHEKHVLHTFKIVSKKNIDDGFGTTFILNIKALDKLVFQSGDLLGIFPPQEQVERFYSIGKINNNTFLLSVKLHPHGICSNFLNSLKVGNTFKGYIKSNHNFHLNLSAPSITFISNGTGITPYLGMVQNYMGEKYLYWGGRKKESWKLYNDYIQEKNFNEFELVFSRENTDNRYIQDLIQTRKAILFYRLQAGGVIMFCGSMQMQEDVIEILDTYARQQGLPSIESWIERDQIKIDTY